MRLWRYHLYGNSCWFRNRESSRRGRRPTARCRVPSPPMPHRLHTMTTFIRKMAKDYTKLPWKDTEYHFVNNCSRRLSVRSKWWLRSELSAFISEMAKMNILTVSVRWDLGRPPKWPNYGNH